MKTVLFVCVHNVGRSQMAEAMLNRLAREKRLPIRGASAGTVAGKQLNPVAVQAMEEIGISMEGQSPKLLNQDMADAADTIISMGCEVDAAACPAKFLLTEDWELDDPAGQPIEKVRDIRDQIRVRIVKLINQVMSG
jgi:arsenate reductase (thioredoxin)